MKRIVFIINPNSGTGNKNTVEKAIAKCLDTATFCPTVRYTEHAGHAEKIADEEARRGTDIVVAVGGDGTVNEVARAIVGTKTALGIIPSGSGNGLARHLRLSMNPAEAIATICASCIKTIDYGTVNGVPFFCTFGVGFDAFISMKFAEAGKRGLKTYVEKTLQDGLRYKPETYRIEIDGETEDQEAFLIACANASQYGNNFYIAPEASTRDGLMDVTILTPFTALESPQIVMQMFSRELSKNSHVKTYRTSRLRIIRQKAGPIHIDGEPMTMDKVLEIEMIPSALRIITNGEPGHRPLAFPTIHAMRTEWGAVRNEWEAMRTELEDMRNSIMRLPAEVEDTFFHNIVEPFHQLFDKVTKDKEE